MFLTKEKPVLFSHNYDTMLQPLLKPYGACRTIYVFNNRLLRRVSQWKAFTDAPLQQPFVWMFRGCNPVFTTAAAFLYFLFLTFSFFSVSPVVAVGSRLLFFWPLVILRDIFWFTSILHSPQWSVCVFLLYFHPVTSLCQILYCVSYKNMHNGSHSWGWVLLLPRYNFISWKTHTFCGMLKKNRRRMPTGLQSCCCWHYPMRTFDESCIWD